MLTQYLMSYEIITVPRLCCSGIMSWWDHAPPNAKREEKYQLWDSASLF